MIINGSPHAKGTTWAALHEMEKIFQEQGIQLGKEAYGLPEKEPRVGTNFIR